MRSVTHPFFRNKEFPQNVNQKAQAKNIADTLLTKQGNVGTRLIGQQLSGAHAPLLHYKIYFHSFHFLLLRVDERAHDLFKTTIARNYDDKMENYIRNTRWKVGVDGFPEYPTPIKDYLTRMWPIQLDLYLLSLLVFL